MKLHNAIRKYLTCTHAEGFPKLVISQYHYVLTEFLKTVGDMNVAMLTYNHVKCYLKDIPKDETQEVSHQAAILRIFVNWLQVQNQIRTLASRYDPTRRPSGWWLITPRRLAVRRKLPLALKFPMSEINFYPNKILG